MQAAPPAQSAETDPVPAVRAAEASLLEDQVVRPRLQDRAAPRAGVAASAVPVEAAELRDSTCAWLGRAAVAAAGAGRRPDRKAFPRCSDSSAFCASAPTGCA